MRLSRPDPAAALLGLRAMKTMASAGGILRPAQRVVMEAARRTIPGIDADIDSLEPVTPADLASGFPEPGLRRQFVDGMPVVALADGVPSREAAATLEAFAMALGVDTPELADLRLLAERATARSPT